jgi:ribonuclease Z
MEEIEIYGTQHTLERVYDLIFGVVLRGFRGKPPVILHAIEPGVFFEAENFTISAFPVEHRGSKSLGYRFEERSRRPFLPEKAEVLNVPPGPWRRDLVNGKTVTLPDGRTIDPDQVLGEPRKGTSLVVVGDTGRPEKVIQYAKDADALVIESTYIQAEEDLAKRFDHLTAVQAAGVAKEAGVGQLFLTHLSRRYRERDVLEEAQNVFQPVYVARDFDHYKILREDD